MLHLVYENEMTPEKAKIAEQAKRISELEHEVSRLEIQNSQLKSQIWQLEVKEHFYKPTPTWPYLSSSRGELPDHVKGHWRDPFANQPDNHGHPYDGDPDFEIPLARDNTLTLSS